MPDDDFFEIPAGTPVRAFEYTRGGGLRVGKLQLKVDGEWIDLSAESFSFEIVHDDLTIASDGLELGCKERCRCGTWQCRGDDPHKPRFGPFHVFPTHPCADLADPKAALDRAAEEDLEEEPDDYQPYWK